MLLLQHEFKFSFFIEKYFLNKIEEKKNNDKMRKENQLYIFNEEKRKKR